MNLRLILTKVKPLKDIHCYLQHFTTIYLVPLTFDTFLYTFVITTFIYFTQGWAAFCLAAMAPLDSTHQTEAANYVRDKRPQQLVGGTGAASTLLFIYAST
jgi:hypothetical protein